MPRLSARSFTPEREHISFQCNTCNTRGSMIMSEEVVDKMDLPNKRLKSSPPPFKVEDDYLPLGGDEEENHAQQYGYGSAANAFEPEHNPTSRTSPPRGLRAMYNNHSPKHGHSYNVRNDPRNARDKPKSKHALPGHEPWVLVKTKFRRRFVHNTQTKESLWRIPRDVMVGVVVFETGERVQKEKEENATWAEEQLRGMQAEKSTAIAAVEDGNAAGKEDRGGRRRSSESLQREDEKAMMAELAAEAEHAEEQDAKQVVKTIEPLQPFSAQQAEGVRGGSGGYDSETSYEEVEVTDSEFEDDGEEEEGKQQRRPTAEDGDAGVDPIDLRDDGPVEFGENDIAYQLAAMGEDYGLDPGEYGDAEDEELEEGAEGLSITEEDAVNLFCEMLDDHHISPFTPWQKLITDDSEASILTDDRYTILPSMRVRKEVWESWCRDTAARLKEERARMEKEDPKIPYLAFLADRAMTTKLYWPEFKRKYKKESAMSDRQLSDKEREKLYREHMNRLKLAESTRKADLVVLLKGVPLSLLNRETGVDELPQKVRGHVHFISLPAAERERIVGQYVSSLPPAPR